MTFSPCSFSVSRRSLAPSLGDVPLRRARILAAFSRLPEPKSRLIMPPSPLPGLLAAEGDSGSTAYWKVGLAKPIFADRAVKLFVSTASSRRIASPFGTSSISRSKTTSPPRGRIRPSALSFGSTAPSALRSRYSFTVRRAFGPSVPVRRVFTVASRARVSVASNTARWTARLRALGRAATSALLQTYPRTGGVGSGLPRSFAALRAASLRSRASVCALAAFATAAASREPANPRATCIVGRSRIHR